jgi:hypothetical protein
VWESKSKAKQDKTIKQTLAHMSLLIRNSTKEILMRMVKRSHYFKTKVENTNSRKDGSSQNHKFVRTENGNIHHWQQKCTSDKLL